MIISMIINDHIKDKYQDLIFHISIAANITIQADFGISMHGLGRENHLEWSSLGRSFERYIHHEWKLFARPRRPRLKQDASDCLKHFDAESHFWKASGASLWDDFWEDDLELCEEIGQSRYVFFCHALPQSRAWRLEASRMGHIGQVLSEVWADEAEEEILSTLRRQVTQEIVQKLGKWNVIHLYTVIPEALSS